jgi:hypothetical protein
MTAEAAPADGDDRVAERYFLVVVSDTSEDAPRLVECESLEAFTAAVNEHVLGAEHTLHVFGFKGTRVGISAPTPVCTVEVSGQKTSVGPDDRSFDNSGRIVPLRRSAT